MTDTPRAYTSEEIRDVVLEEVRQIARHWADPKLDRDLLGRCNGVAFSILALLDGCSIGIPAIDLVIQPHEGDKDHNIRNGDNWFEPGTVIDDGLHDHYYKAED